MRLAALLLLCSSALISSAPILANEAKPAPVEAAPPVDGAAPQAEPPQVTASAKVDPAYRLDRQIADRQLQLEELKKLKDRLKQPTDPTPEAHYDVVIKEMTDFIGHLVAQRQRQIDSALPAIAAAGASEKEIEQRLAALLSMIQRSRARLDELQAKYATERELGNEWDAEVLAREKELVGADLKRLLDEINKLELRQNALAVALADETAAAKPAEEKAPSAPVPAPPPAASAGAEKKPDEKDAVEAGSVKKRLRDIDQKKETLRKQLSVLRSEQHDLSGGLDLEAARVLQPEVDEIISQIKTLLQERTKLRNELKSAGVADAESLTKSEIQSNGGQIRIELTFPRVGDFVYVGPRSLVLSKLIELRDSGRLNEREKAKLEPIIEDVRGIAAGGAVAGPISQLRRSAAKISISKKEKEETGFDREQLGDLPRQHEALSDAIQNLESIGRHDLALSLQREADRIKAALLRATRSKRADDDAPLMQAVRELRKEVRETRREVAELRKLVEKPIKQPAAGSAAGAPAADSERQAWIRPPAIPAPPSDAYTSEPVKPEFVPMRGPMVHVPGADPVLVTPAVPPKTATPEVPAMPAAPGASAPATPMNDGRGSGVLPPASPNVTPPSKPVPADPAAATAPGTFGMVYYVPVTEVIEVETETGRRPVNVTRYIATQQRDTAGFAATPDPGEFRKRSSRPALHELERHLRLTRVTMKMENSSLYKILMRIGAQANVRIEVDNKSLGMKDDAWKFDDRSFSIDVKDVPASKALFNLLDPYGLSYVVKDGAVTITTRDRAASRLMRGDAR